MPQLIRNSLLTYSWLYDFSKDGPTGSFQLNIQPPAGSLNLVIFRQNITTLTGNPASSILYGETGLPGHYGSELQPSYFNNGAVQQLAVCQGGYLTLDILGNLTGGIFKVFYIFANMKNP